MELLLSHEKERNNAICINMHGPRIVILSEVSQMKKSITYMWNFLKMIDMNLFTKQKQTHRLRE